MIEQNYSIAFPVPLTAQTQEKMGSTYQFHILTSGLLLIQALGGVRKVFINVFL